MASATFPTDGKLQEDNSPWAAWLIPLVLALGALLIVAGAGWWGYQRQLAGPSPSGTDLAAQATSASAGASAATATPPPRSVQPVAQAAARSTAPAASSSTLNWPLWEFRLRQPIPPRDPSLTPPRWRLVGSTLSGGKWAIIVLRQGKTDPEYFSVGQELPGGYRIAAISEEDVTLVQGKRTMVLSYIGSR
jgi:hypothetical protein